MSEESADQLFLSCAAARTIVDRIKGEIICISNGNTKRWSLNSELSNQLSATNLPTLCCKFSCNLDLTCYLMRAQTFNSLPFQPLSCASRPLPTLTIMSIVHFLPTYTHDQLQQLSLKLSVEMPDSSYASYYQLDCCWKIRNQNH